MSAPTDVVTIVKDLTFINDSTRDSLIDFIWDREARALLINLDLSAEEQSQTAVSGQSTYSVNSDTIRILGILYDSVALYKTTGYARDRVDPTWQSKTSTLDPEIWWNDRIAEEVDTVTVDPEHFFIYPDATGTDTIRAYVIAEPASMDFTTTWIDPLLSYRTTSRLIVESAEENERGTEGGETAKLTSDFFGAVATVWETLIKDRLSI